MLKMTRRKLVEQKYPYAINSRTNGRVITTVREDGKLKQISAVTMDDILNKLYLFYFENKKNLTLNDLFPEWKAERLNDMKSIMIALMRIAIDEEIIVENPINGIYIKVKFRAVRKKSDGSKLYLNDEFDALDTHLEEECTIEALCIQLMFQLGVRIGEGVGLLQVA